MHQPRKLKSSYEAWNKQVETSFFANKREPDYCAIKNVAFTQKHQSFSALKNPRQFPAFFSRSFLMLQVISVLLLNILRAGNGHITGSATVLQDGQFAALRNKFWWFFATKITIFKIFLTPFSNKNGQDGDFLTSQIVFCEV